MNKYTSLVKIPYILAPMAGYSDVGFRALCAGYGAGLTVTEMISVNALSQNNRVSFDLMRFSDAEKVSCVQLFGNDPRLFREVLEGEAFVAIDIIDINMGCPVPKVAGKGSGSALMLDLPLAEKIIAEVCKSGKCVTVKFRKGYDENNINGVEFAKMCEGAGADAITVHSRTRKQMYSGTADFGYFERVAGAVSIPVVANGDIKSKAQGDRIIKESGVFAVMIGRASLGNPQIFAATAGNEITLTEKERLDNIIFHLDMLSYLPERVVLDVIRKHIAHYLKFRPNHNRFLASINNIKSIEGLKSGLAEFLR